MNLRRRALGMIAEEDSMRKIFEAEFEIGEADQTNAYTTIATIETGFSENDVEEGDIFIVEIRMLEDQETDDTLCRQLDRFEPLMCLAGKYFGAGYTGGNPCYMSTGAIMFVAANGVFVYSVGRYMSTVTIATRRNGNPAPCAGRYKLLIYGFGNIVNDYRQV